MSEKKYGLILPKKNQLSAPRQGNVFGNDDDSEEEEGTDWVRKALKGENEKNKVKKQTKLNMQKALKEDPTIFQYDEVYDDIERAKEEEKQAIQKVEKKPKYIHNLLKSADLRKKEQELRKDKIIQKEIEAEDSMYPDKERFVTSSYKAKLEEMKKFEEEQEYKDRLEAISDITKQKDMSGFYRHLYRQTVEKNEADLGIAPKVTERLQEPEEKDSIPELAPDIDKDDPIPSDSESNETSKSDIENNTKDSRKSSTISKIKRKRQYRKRVQEESESESESESELNKSNRVDEEKLSKVDNDLTETPSKVQRLTEEVKENEKDSNSESFEKNVKPAQTISENVSKDSIENKSLKDKTITEKKSVPVEKKKINIWAKRTVGPVFEAALERYLIRKQQRLAGS